MILREASILVVDDEPVLRMTFAVVLRQLGATVHLAAHGAEALGILSMHHVDLMLTDQQMPVMNGVTLLDILEKRGGGVPAILFVNGIDSKNPADLRRWGIVETLTKPVHPEHLIRVLTEALHPLPGRAQ